MLAPRFNALTVDACTSTNDTVLLLRERRRRGHARAPRAPPSWAAWPEAFGEVGERLAAAADRRRRGRDARAADRGRRARRPTRTREPVAQAVADSPLVKTAAFGARPEPGQDPAGRRCRRGRASDLGPSTSRIGERRRGRGGVIPPAYFEADGDLRRRRSPAMKERRGRRCAITIGDGPGPCACPRVRPVLRVRPHQRGVHDLMSAFRPAAADPPAHRGEGAHADSRRCRSCASTTARSIVVKYGGAAMETRRPRGVVRRGRRAAAERRHHAGGRARRRPAGDRDVRARSGIETTFVDGLRVTDAETLDVATMVLAGKLNTEVVASLVTRRRAAPSGCPASTGGCCWRGGSRRPTSGSSARSCTCNVDVLRTLLTAAVRAGRGVDRRRRDSGRPTT